MTEFINTMMEFSDKAYDVMWSVVMICLGIMATRALARWSDTEQLIKELAETYLRHRARMREKYSRTAKSLVVWVVAASAVGVSSVSAANTFPTSSPETAAGPTRPPSFPLEARKTDLSSFPSIRMFAFLSAAQDYESCVEAVHDDPLEPLVRRGVGHSQLRKLRRSSSSHRGMETLGFRRSPSKSRQDCSDTIKTRSSVGRR